MKQMTNKIELNFVTLQIQENQIFSIKKHTDKWILNTMLL